MAISESIQRLDLVPARALGADPANLLARGLSRLFSLNFNFRPRYRQYLKTCDGWLDFSVALRTPDQRVALTLCFREGRVRVLRGAARNADTTLIFANRLMARDLLSMSPDDILLALMRNQVRVEGNLSLMALFNFLLSLLTQGKSLPLHAPAAAPVSHANKVYGANSGQYLQGCPSDAVSHLTDPYLSRIALDDFPRLQHFLHIHFHKRPEICIERPLLLTRWHRQYGFEKQPDGTPWHPVLRQGKVLKALLADKAPRIRDRDLLGGTTTSKDIGVVIYPDAQGTLIWNELRTVAARTLNPYDISAADQTTLHREIFPFWIRRNFREWVRQQYGNPLCQRIEERFAVFFHWKNIALSHTIADFPRLLRQGSRGMLADIDAAIAACEPGDEERQHTLAAMRLALEGLEAYAAHVAQEAAEQSRQCDDPVRRLELEQIARLCRRVPMQPPASVHEALQAIWLGLIGLHMENTNAGLSIGRLDQWLQPYFLAEMQACRNDTERDACIARTIELCGCFFLKLTDHLPLVPDLGNHLFGGSSSDQAITLGGVTPDGESAVNDMTYILLKVTEMLRLRDPNINARYHVGKNSDVYLRRLCEVNLLTCATPSLHGDENVMAALASHGYPQEVIRDWSAVGCVEPTLSGQHLGHTGCMMFNLVAPLEMALHDGWHPLMDWRPGRRTGDAASFECFDDFYLAFEQQLGFLIEQAVTLNNYLGEAHAVLRPTPLLSALMAGTLASGRDVTRGGARYNSSGVACIGLADVTDSLMSVRHLVFDKQVLSLGALRDAVANNFEGNAKLLSRIQTHVPRYGSGDAGALAMARRVMASVHRHFSKHRNFRGGPYTTGYWSMSNHVVFGNLAGALPSGRRAGVAFTPGLTPAPQATANLLDNLRDVAMLEPAHMDNNIAFNVKYVPAAEDGHARSVQNMADYVKSYFSLGGMQMQFNVVSSATLRDAMAHPENYADLLVRISGYNAYFVTLNQEMQHELIQRAEFSA